MVPKYFIVIRGDTVDCMTEEALHFAYLFLSRALELYRREGDGEYEAFALAVLVLLRKYRHPLHHAAGPSKSNLRAAGRVGSHVKKCLNFVERLSRARFLA